MPIIQCDDKVDNSFNENFTFLDIVPFPNPLITIISGGTGSIKLIRGFNSIDEDLAIILNVGDNVWKYGLYICPDIDTVIYGLSGLLDTKRGWGIKGDTFNFVDQTGKLGQENWFRVGDMDLATHVLRTELLKKGKRLTQITESFRAHYGLKARLFPVSDDSIETRVVTSLDEMNIQEFWIKNAARPRVVGVKYVGARHAKLSAEAIECIRKSEKIIIAPANPISSIGPSLAVPKLRHELSKIRKKVIAISPIEGTQAFSGPATKYMRGVGLEVSPAGVAKYYSDVIGTFIISERDYASSDRIRKLGIDLFLTDITMRTVHQESRLASFVMDI
jgi:LPPG:FO 2-phospho-L-lactate transferase